MPIPNLRDNDFAILGVAQQFDQQDAVLLQHWKNLQAQIHPDRFASQGEAAQRLATQWPVRVNEAYQKIKNPVSRAALLCELAGYPIDPENNTAMPAEFLMQQMQWREALEEARTITEVEQLQQTVATERIKALSTLSWLIDEKGDFVQAAQQTRALMFIDRFLQDIHNKLDLLDV